MPEVSPTRYLVQAGWNSVPHLDEQARRELLASTPLHERDARSKGIPTLGVGAIYPVDLEQILVDPIPLPAHWPRAYGLDVGWEVTAAIWGALERETDTLYLYAEYYAGRAEPTIHAAAIRARGEWIPGVVDPASAGASQVDGRRLIDEYRGLGLQITPADNVIEAGIVACHDRMTTGRMKVFRTCRNWQRELRQYHRVEQDTKTQRRGAIVKKHDHGLDAMRYLVVSGLSLMRTRPALATGAAAAAADSVVGY